MSHTKEPWSVAEESFDNDGIQESVIRGLGGRAVIAVTLEFGQNNPGMREANARRIVACVNACAGIPSVVLETAGRFHEFDPAEVISLLEKQRDELLAAAQQAERWIAQEMLEKGWPQDRIDLPPPGSHLFNLRAAIASVKGERE